MPVVNLTVEPAPQPTPLAVWVCCLCLRTTELIGPAGEPLDSNEYFIDELGWARLSTEEVVCDRCKRHPDVTHLLLARAGARTQ